MYKIMAVNAGSSSLKFKLFEMPEEKVIAEGIFDSADTHRRFRRIFMLFHFSLKRAVVGAYCAY